MVKEQVLQRWLATIDDKRKVALATVLPSETAEKYHLQSQRVLFSGHEQVGKLGDISIERKVIAWIKRKFLEKEPQSESRVFLLGNEEKIDIFLDIFTPPMEVMIFGAGHDAIPLAANSVSLGYPTTVVDVRDDFNTEARFPHTKRIILKNSDLYYISITERTYIVVMNHHIEKDEQTLAFVLKSPSPYVGLLGPLSRRNKILKRLEEKGVAFSEREMSKLNSPVGLDIGASSPKEIAISILGEIIALKNDHTAGFLHGSEKIHL